MWHSAHIPPHVFRPRPVEHTHRTARPVSSSEPVNKVELQLESENSNSAYTKEAVITVAEIMERDIMTVAPHLGLETLAHLFVEKRVSGFPVVDNRGELLGLVSQKDLLNGVSPDGRVEDIMTPYVYFATPETDIKEVIALMLEKGIHRVVVTQSRLLKGMVTTSQLLRVLHQLL